jgi:hypothetical protein
LSTIAPAWWHDSATLPSKDYWATVSAADDRKLSDEKRDMLLLWALAWTASGAERKLEAELASGALSPAWTTEGVATVNAVSQGSKFRFGLRLPDQVRPVGGDRHWAGVENAA